MQPGLSLRAWVLEAGPTQSGSLRTWPLRGMGRSHRQPATPQQQRRVPDRSNLIRPFHLAFFIRALLLPATVDDFPRARAHGRPRLRPARQPDAILWESPRPRGGAHRPFLRCVCSVADLRPAGNAAQMLGLLERSRPLERPRPPRFARGATIEANGLGNAESWCAVRVPRLGSASFDASLLCIRVDGRVFCPGRTTRVNWRATDDRVRRGPLARPYTECAWAVVY